MQNASALQPPFATAHASLMIGGMHMPATHVASALHDCSHAPQFALSVLTSTHVLPQGSSPTGHETSVGWPHAAIPHSASQISQNLEGTRHHSNKSSRRSSARTHAIVRGTVETMGLWTRVVIAVLATGSVASAEPAAIGKAKIVSGKVLVIRGSAKTPVKVGDTLNEHDVFETAADGSLGVTFTDNTSFSIGPNSHVAIDTYFFDPKNLKGNMLAQLKKGTMMVRTGELTRQQPGSVQIKTPRTVLGVRGTTFVVSVDP